MKAEQIIKCTRAWDGYTIDIPAQRFPGRFPMRTQSAADVFALLDAQGVAPFMASGGQAWIASLQ